MKIVFCGTPRFAVPTLEALIAAGHDVMLDDRDERPGVKFKDAELIGIPYRISFGSRDLAEGMVEVVSRETGERERVAVDQVVKHVQDLLPPPRR